jgi:hypothetical protein
LQLEACETIRTKPIKGSIRSDKRPPYKEEKKWENHLSQGGI